MFKEKITDFKGECAIKVTGLGEYSLRDTLECGQAFRYELITDTPDYREYLTVIYGRLLRVGQEHAGELYFFTDDEEYFDSVIAPYFSLETDYLKIRDSIKERTDSEWLKRAADSAAGIAILKQEPWEVLLSFIISQNNNIPRIRKIIRKICSVYGECLAEKEGLTACPLGKCEGAPSGEKCKSCGICYSFPTPDQILEKPEGLLEANPGFRYRYMLSAAERVAAKETNLDMIGAARSYAYTLEELKKITGVGDKVASCVALFGFANLDAFPIDVWMKRAIDEYFGGHLDHTAFGRYAGVAQQYIFHYIRNIEAGKENDKKQSK